MARKIVTTPVAALTEVITPEQAATLASAKEVAEKKAADEKKLLAKKKKEAKAKAERIKKDKENAFTYTLKQIPESYGLRFARLKELGLCEESMNLFFKKAFEKELKAREEENGLEPLV